MSQGFKKSNDKGTTRPEGGRPETAKEKVKGRRVLPEALRLIDAHHEHAVAGCIEAVISERCGWLVRETAGSSLCKLPEILECVKCCIKGGKRFIDDVPVYFELDTSNGNYVEAPELYEPMRNPKSRALQEMLAGGAPLYERYEQFEEQRREKEN
jgi:hypothetical protein